MDIEATADRLASLLLDGGGGLREATSSGLEFEASLSLEPLQRTTVPPDCWAVDGGQALVADARSLQVYATRASTVRWRSSRTVMEDEGALRIHLLGSGEERAALAALESPVDPKAAVDVNLLRDWGEWEAVASAVELAEAGGMVLVDGDLQPDWRIPAWWLSSLLERANSRQVVLAGVTKHSSLSRGGAPLVGALEQQAAAELGRRATWWTRVARTRPEVGSGLQVVVARLDPDAPYAFRVDLPADSDAPAALGALSALCDDAAFPGYPYPLSVADRVAACAGWVRSEVWDRMSERFDRRGVPTEVRERAFDDRHRMMERA